MNTTTSIVALMMGFALAGASDARAQAPSPTDHGVFINISAGAQATARTFSDSSTFTLFNETAQVRANQTVNGGFVFDASAGYRVWKRLSLALGVSTSNVTGDAAVAATIPNAVLPNRPTVLTATASGLRQNDVAVNFQAVWEVPITPKIDLSIFVGPSFIHVSQEFATATPSSGISAAAIETQSANTAKAGTGGVDLRFKMTERMGIGVFARYAGGEADLPLKPKMKIGGLQFGGGLRLRF